MLFFCRPHLASVKGEISCGSSFCDPCSGKNIKTIIQKKSTILVLLTTRSVEPFSPQVLLRLRKPFGLRFTYCVVPLILVLLSHPCRPPPPLTSTFTPCFQQLWLRVWQYYSTLHYCLIVLTLDLSAAYLELNIVLRRADFVSPSNRSSNLSLVLPVGCSSPPCAW